MASTSPSNASPLGQPHLVSLVLQSKKALQHGQVICSKANAISNASTQEAIDVLALDAKLRWVTDAVLDQLKMASQVARSIEHKQAHIERQAEEWDAIRLQRTDGLDALLESLGAQVVPPDFHTIAPSEPSPFGIQHDSDNDDTALFGEQQPSQIPTETLRNVVRNAQSRINGVHRDKSSWKTLRDFVDERAIEDMLDAIESDRNVLDHILGEISDYPESLLNTIATIEENVTVNAAVPEMQSVFAAQEAASIKMATLLESLAAHYDQMAAALKDHEAGDEFGEEDIRAMNRDTEELPSIIGEMEEGFSSIEAAHEQLRSAKRSAEERLETQRRTLDDLDELGEIMGEMLERQQAVEHESSEHLVMLHRSLVAIEDLQHRFTSYQYSFNKLLLELARRRQYREAAERIVQGMIAQLDAMTEEERQRRGEFNAEHGHNLPEDVCLFMPNMPTRWNVVPWNGEREVLPEISPDLLDAARNQTNIGENGLGASQSL